MALPSDIPTPENLERSRQQVEEEQRRKAERDAKLSPLDKAFGAYEAARTIGSALYQNAASFPTFLSQGQEAADKQVAERMFIPKTEQGMDYLQNTGQFLEKLETEYKIPPVLPQVAALEGIAGPAIKQAARAAGEAMPPMSGSGVRGLAYQEGAIKPFGGQWFKDTIFDKPSDKQPHLQALERDLQDPNISAANKEILQRQYTHLKNTDALKRWEKGNLANYIKNKMGTPEDPIRELAERGITHIPQDPDWNEYVAIPQSVAKKRQEAGFPAEGVGKSPLARLWESMADEAIFPEKASTYQAASQARGRLSEMQPDLAAGVERVNRSFEESLRNSGLPASEVKNRSLYTHVADKARLVKDKDFESLWGEQDRLNKILSGTTGYIAKQNPWISKLDPDEPVYRAKIRNLGFDHVLDVLREDMNAGRIRPDQLNKMSIEDAIKRTHEYDQAMAKKMRETTAAVREGLPVYKQYPEGYRWIELNKPGSFAHESDMMGHSVRGYEPPKGHEDWVETSKDYGSEGYGHGGWDAIKSGRAKVYSLVDEKGEPHVTVEVAKDSPKKSDLERQPQEVQNEFNRLLDNWLSNLDYRPNQEDYLEKTDQLFRHLGIDTKPYISQIKGKSNQAPKETYLPFVQDFVRGGKWSQINDTRNAGLRRYGDVFNVNEQRKIESLGGNVPDHEWLTGEEIQQLHNLITPEGGRLKYDSKGNIIGGDGKSGYKQGGKVHISSNPDTMRIELAEGKKMQFGGIAKAAAKSAAKAAKEAPSVVIPSKVSQLQEAIRQSKGEYGAKRVQRAADEIKNLEQMYQEEALRQAFSGDNAKALVTMNPADFEKYAVELQKRTEIGPEMAKLAQSGEIDKSIMTTDEYIRHLLNLQGGFADIPFLSLFKDEVGVPVKPQVRGHEGRHRSRALAQRGEPSSLVTVFPRGDLREALPRRSQEEYIEALKEEMERSGRLVMPEVEGSLRRPAIEFPDVYAEGGSVKMQFGGIAKISAKSAAKAAKAIEPSPASESAQNLKKFLEGSKVVDDEGNPLRVYHGTEGEDFGSFRPASFFTTHPQEASAYANDIEFSRRNRGLNRYSLVSSPDELSGTKVPYSNDIDAFPIGTVVATDNGVFKRRKGGWDVFDDLDVDYDSFNLKDDNIRVVKGAGESARKWVDRHREDVVKSFPGGEGGRVIPVYLSMRNPVHLGPLQANKLGLRLGATEEDIRKAIDKYSRMGYDGIITESDEATMFDEVREFFGGIPDQYIIFRPEQVKSAIGNRGTYDINDPDITKAGGGPVKMAGGGSFAKSLAKLARAQAKSRQEIDAIAERIAPQVTGEYVRESDKSARTVAGKTQKQFEREKDLPVDIRPDVEQKVPAPVDIESLKGSVMIGIPGDPTVTAQTLHGVGDVKLKSPSPQHGGPLYGLYGDPEHFWASGLGAASRVQNLAEEAGRQYDAPVVGKYVMMGPESINYAQHFADANLQAIDTRKMTREQIEGFNELIRKGNPKSGPRPSFPGIQDKGGAYLHFSVDPELRKHFNSLMQQPTVVDQFGLPSGQDIRMAITEPALRNLETGVTGFSMGRMKPEVKKQDLSLSPHPTYSHDIPGEFIGQSKYPVPYELSFPDTLKAIRENPKQAPQEFGSLKMVGPRQTIDQQLIDEIKMYEEKMKRLTGKKKGGAVKKRKVKISNSRDAHFLASLD